MLWGLLFLGVLCAVLAGYLISLRLSLREIADALDERLQTDTNTLITVSSADSAVRALAARLNVRLRALRTERLRLQNGDAELKAALTNAAHDLRTPLTAISGYLDLLEAEPLPVKAQDYLAVIRERSDALKDLSEELFRYAVAVSTANELVFAPVRVNDVLEQSVVAFYGALAERGITPELQFTEAAVVRMLDGAALRRVFGNILSNAVKYSGGDLRITLSSDGSVCFANHAPGLDAVQVRRLFDRFYTVESGAKSTGLGLSIAKLLTEQMHGSIDAQYRDGELCIRVNFPAGACTF